MLWYTSRYQLYTLGSANLKLLVGPLIDYFFGLCGVGTNSKLHHNGLHFTLSFYGFMYMEFGKGRVLYDVKIKLLRDNMENLLECFTVFASSKQSVGIGTSKFWIVTKVDINPLEFVLLDLNTLGKTLMSRFLNCVGRKIILIRTIDD